MTSSFDFTSPSESESESSLFPNEKKAEGSDLAIGAGGDVLGFLVGGGFISFLAAAPLFVGNTFAFDFFGGFEC